MVDKNGEKYMKFYENGRLFPFREAKKGFHTNEGLQMAYDSWANAEPLNRQEEWFIYCDLRDGLAIGTNKATYQRHKQQEGRLNEPRYVSVK